MTAEFWAILTVGVGIAALNLTLYGLVRRDLTALQSDMASVKERLAHIEGWIQGRFREGAEA